MRPNTYILGAGATGLAAGSATQYPILERESHPGGICSTYYLSPHETKRRYTRYSDLSDYRFELGGGHWIFNVNATTTKLLSRYGKYNAYQRKSSVYFSEWNLFVPYPIQYHLSYLPADVAQKAFVEISAGRSVKPTYLSDWLLETFGITLYKLFFGPFHDLYTAGLASSISAEDQYKTPINRETVELGMKGKISQVGYNTSFLYPEDGLGHIFSKMAENCTIEFNKEVIQIDEKNIFTSDGKSYSYNHIISTLPLVKALHLTKITTPSLPDPYTSVLVLNIGAERGISCPDDHWVYLPKSNSGFHRVGFYSNIEKQFLPTSSNAEKQKVSLYVERAYAGGAKPSITEIEKYKTNVIAELQTLGFIGKPDIVDPTWIEVAYTWKNANSRWVEEVIRLLRNRNIYSIGRYGKWRFQGIAQSLLEGYDFSLPKHES